MKPTPEQQQAFAKAVRLDRMLRSLVRNYSERMILRSGVSRIALGWGSGING
jgi:hypothetical protein